MSASNSSSDDDWLVILTVLTVLVGTGVISLGTIFAPLTDWLLKTGIAVSPSTAVLAIGPLGFDLPRLLIAAALLTAVLLIGRKLLLTRLQREHQ